MRSRSRRSAWCCDQFTQQDASLIFDLDQDPEVIRFVDLEGPVTLEDVQGDILPYLLDMYREHPGLGSFAAFEKATGAYIGWFHFRPAHESPEEIDLGYRLHRRYWGRGYATEGSRALIHRGFTELGVERVTACALLANRASTRVMEKCGLILQQRYEEPRATFPDKRAVKYALDRALYMTRETAKADQW